MAARCEAKNKPNLDVHFSGGVLRVKRHSNDVSLPGGRKGAAAAMSSGKEVEARDHRLWAASLNTRHDLL